MFFSEESFLKSGSIWKREVIYVEEYTNKNASHFGVIDCFLAND